MQGPALFGKIAQPLVGPERIDLQLHPDDGDAAFGTVPRQVPLEERFGTR